jgi:hypothetical protein
MRRMCTSEAAKKLTYDNAIEMGVWMVAFLVAFLLGAAGAGFTERPVWNISNEPVESNGVLVEQLSRVLSADFAQKSSVNISDDFRFNWSVFWGANNTLFADSKEGGGSLRVHTREASGSVVAVSADVVIHRDTHPSEWSSQWQLQGLFFPKERKFVGLMHSSSGMGMLENVRTPLQNMTAATLLAQLSRLGPNLTSPGWLPYDEMQKSTKGLFGGYFDASVRHHLCYFVVSGIFVNTDDFSQPAWRRPTVPGGRGLGNPLVGMEMAAMSPNCMLVLKIEGRSIYVRGLMQASNDYAVVVLLVHIAFSVSLFRQMRRTLTSSLNAVNFGKPHFSVFLC